MVAARTTDELVTAVDTRCLLPSADGRLTTTEKLELASQRLTSTIANMLTATRSSRWVQAGSDVAIVSGTYLYDVPERALAAGVCDIVVTDGTIEWPASEYNFDDAARYRRDRGGWDGPYAYTWLDDKIELLPHPTTTGYSLRIYYPRAAPKLVPTTSCAPITAVGGSSVTATSAQTILGATATVDIVKGAPNGNPRGMDLSASNSGSTCTVTVPSGTAVGDYVCPAGQTCVVPMPQSLWQVLVIGTSADVQGALGDKEAQAALELELQAAITDAKSLLEPRSRGAQPKIASPFTPLRQRRGWR